MILLVCRSISLMMSASDTFLIDSVASIDLARDLSALVNLATLLTTHFWKIKFHIPRFWKNINARVRVAPA